MARRTTAELRARALVVSLFCGVAALAEPDPSWNISPVARMGGWCWAVQVDGQYAYIGEGGSLTILSVWDRSSPLPLGALSFDDFAIHDIRVKDGFAYVAGASVQGQHGLRIVDVTNPSSPRLRAFYSTPIQARGVYVSGRLAYVACGRDSDLQGGFQVIDVSDPSSPTLRGSFMSMPFYAWKICVSDNIAFVAARDGLHLFDVTDPSLPTRLGLYRQNWSNDVLVAGDLAYTATDTGLEIVDVTNPATPTLSGGLHVSQAWGISLTDGLAILTQLYNGPTRPNGLIIVDVTDPSSCTSVGSVTTEGMAWDVAVSSGTAYLADGPGGVSLVDITTPSKPLLGTSYDTLSDARDVCVFGQIAYVANGVRGLKIVEVSIPRSPKPLATFRTKGPAEKVLAFDGMAYVCGTSGYPTTDLQAILEIVDVTTPSSPTLVGFYERSGAFGAFTVRDGLAYIVHTDGLQIVDIENPAAPTLRGTFDALSLSSDVFVSGNLAFVADYDSVQIVDVNDPTSPFLRSSFPTDRWRRIYDVYVSDGVAYMTGVRASTGADFACVDVRNPDAPALLGTYDVPGYDGGAGGLHISNGRAYVLLDRLRVLDVSDPAAPELCGLYPVDRYSYYDSGVFASDDLVYLTDIMGLRIFQLTGAADAGRSWLLYK